MIYITHTHIKTLSEHEIFTFIIYIQRVPIIKITEILKL